MKNYKKKFNYFDASVGEFSYIVIQNIIIAILMLALALGAPRDSWMSYVFSAIVEIGFVGAAFFSAKVTKTNIVCAAGLNKKIKGKEALLVLLIAVIAIFGFSSITNSFADFLTNIGYQSDSSLNVDTWGKFFLFTFLMAIVPAFCEELLFRGVIFRGLRSWNKIGAVFISALLFMLMHGSPDQTIHQFLLGIVLALLFDATGSIWAPMLLHFLNNFIALMMNFIYNMAGLVSDDVVEGVAEKTPWGTWVISLLIALAITAFAGWLIWLLVSSIKKERQKEEQKALALEPQLNAENSAQNLQTEAVALDASQNLELDQPKVSSGQRTAAIVLFVLSGISLLYDWISALLAGL